MIKTTFILIAIIISSIFVIYKLTNFIIKTIKHKCGKHFCNKCKLGFILNLEELNYKYCPYCGQELDYHEKYEA